MKEHKRFRLPEDAWIFGALSLVHGDYLVGGSVAQHLYLSPGEPASFKDLDLCVGAGFMESARRLYPELDRIIRSGRFPETGFDERGMLSSPRRKHTIGGVDYPAKLWMFVRGLPVDTFVVDLDAIPRTTGSAWGHAVGLVAPEHAIRTLESMRGTEFASRKKPSVEERIARLRPLVNRPPFGT